MKRLLFSVAGLSFVIASGCYSSGGATGNFKGTDNGPELTTSSGSPIVVTKNPVATPEPTPPGENASYAERQAYRQKVAARQVQISVQSAQVALENKNDIAEAVLTKIKLAKKESLNDVRAFVDFDKVTGRPKVKSEVISGVAAAKQQSLDEGAVVALQALIEPDVYDYLAKEVYPVIVRNITATLLPKVDGALSAGKFAYARELVWGASTYNVPEIDDPVRKAAMEIMHGKVNPQNWAALEKTIDEVFTRAMSSKAYDKGIADLKKLESESVVREYAVYIDKKIAAVSEELKKLGVSEQAMKPILAKQSEIVAAAAKIPDVRDEQITLVDAKKEIREIEARKDPALKQYYEKLDEFHDVLIWYNCTKDNADRISNDLDKDLLALVQMLRKPAKFKTEETGAITALKLGTRSLNERIRSAVKHRIRKLEEARDAGVRAAYLAKLQAAKTDLEKRVMALVAESKFEEARELIWNASITGDVEWDTDMFACGLSLLRNRVNPADWLRIEKDINAKFKILSGEGRFDELISFLNTYPRIRQHTVKLDDQLAKVRAAAEALGADPKATAKAAATACAMVTEAEKLVDHLDKLEANAAKQGKGIDKAELEKELVIYAQKLAAYHATEKNVQSIVAKLRSELEKLLANPTNPDTTHLSLGTNAVNDRIKALTAKLIASIEAVKAKWQTERLALVVSDLEKRVRKAVKEERYDDARKYIRDEQLIGRQDVDLKLYEIRVGLLDSCVNPAQLDYLLAEIDKKVQSLIKAKDYAGLLDYIANPPQVHDEYTKIESALVAVKNAMLALEISGDEVEKDTKISFFQAIQEILEKRRESWKPERDLSAVEKALTEVAKAMFDHLNKHPELIEGTKKAEYAHILADIAALDRTITTWEMNERLRARLAKTLPTARHGREMQLYTELLAKIDGEVSFDTQVMLAEEAISRQLGVKCEVASFKINALLGEYARAFRLLKQGAKLTEAESTSVLLGGAYLDQAAVVQYAIKLGARIDGCSARDPRKRTALMLAIDTQHLSLVKAILEAGASSTAADADGNTVMHYAVKSGSVAMVQAIAKTAPMVVVNKAGETPLFAAVRRNQTALVEAVAALVAEGERAAFVNMADKNGLTAFALAAKTGARDVLDALAAAGARYSEKDLILAEKSDHVAIAQWLVAKGADVNADGVMAAACPSTATGSYLVREGGVCAGHKCAACQPDNTSPASKATACKSAKSPVEAKKIAEAEGTITFKVHDAK